MAYLVPGEHNREAVRTYLREALTFSWGMHDSGSLEWQGQMSYVQWAGWPEGVVIECSSAQHMGYEHSPAQLEALRALGFHDPTDEWPNHFVKITNEHDLEGAADALVTVLFDVLGEPQPHVPPVETTPIFALPDVPAKEEPAPGVDIDVPCVLLRISKLWHPAMDVDEVYDAVRGWWVMGPKRERAAYALAVAKGKVRGVYAIHAWESKGGHHGGLRWAFDGEPAEELEHLVGADVSGLFPPGAANPVRYLNCERAAAEVAALRTTAASATDENALERVTARLMRSSLLPLSLGAKELFHSNFLAWLLERNPRCAAIAFPEVVPGESGFLVRREAQHLDLVVEGASNLVIENKVFSLPDEDQLERYSSVNVPALGLDDPALVLLSLTDPGWPERRFGDWTWLGYGELAERVERGLSETPFEDPFDTELARRWVSLVRDLTQLVQLVEPTDLDEPLLLDPRSVEVLRPIRLVDAVAKVRSSRAMHLLRHQLRTRGVGFDLIESSFRNGTPLLSAAVAHPDGCLVGWQLQSRQWRRFVKVSPGLAGRGETMRARRSEHVQREHGAWFDFALESSLVPTGSSPSNDYKHFAPDFVYDYVRVENLRVSNFLELAHAVLRAAHQAAAPSR